jgi:CheY-like chemotaxis protein
VVATVLVVDDDALSREFMATLLGYRGHQIQEASDGDSALVSVERDRPDAVITDVLMPGLDGYELARALRDRPTTRHIPIVFSTAHYGPDEIRPLADACNVHDVIFKPAHPATVLATIDRLPIARQVSVHAADQVVETQRLTHSGTWELDAASNTIVVSAALRDLLRLASMTLSVDEFARRVHPDDIATVRTVARNVWRTGSPGTVELRVADAEGVVHELIVSCRAAHPRESTTQPETPTRPLWGVVQDVTSIRDGLRAHLQVQTDWQAVRRTIEAFHRAVLPGALPTVAGADVAAVYVPAPERLDIGAAWYDALPVHGERVLLSVGKVAGHDRHPGAVMGHALAALRAYAYDDCDPAGVLVRLNRFLADTGQDDTFVTAVVALFDPGSGRLRVANGGHPAPFVVSPDRAGDAVAGLLTAAGPALGILAQAEFPELDLHLAPGAVLGAYTDGLIDRHGDPTSAGSKHLVRVAARVCGRLNGAEPGRPPSAQLLAETIVREVLGVAIPDDDACLAVLRAGTNDR